jgi:hypothetical protein
MQGTLLTGVISSRNAHHVIIGDYRYPVIYYAFEISLRACYFYKPMGNFYCHPFRDRYWCFTYS